MVVVGGVIPPQDYDALNAGGCIGGVFGPWYSHRGCR